MKTLLHRSALFGIALAAMNLSASATPITIVNGTFDVINNPVNPAAITLGDAASGYVYTEFFGTGQIVQKSSGSTGPSNADFPGWVGSSFTGSKAAVQILGTDYVAAGTSSGLYGYISPENNGGLVTMSQVLTDSLIANTKYTLTLDLAHRIDQGNPGSEFSIQLLAGATNLINVSPTTTTTFQNFSYEYTSPGSGAEIGQALKIQFSSVVPSNSGKQTLIDNVTLDAVAVPEPSAAVLLTIGAFGLLAVRRKRSLL